MNPSVLAVSFFSSPGAVADNFLVTARALASQCDLYVLTSPLLKGQSIRGAKDACFPDFSKHRITSWLNPRSWHTVRRYVQQREYDLLFIHTEHPLHAPIARLTRARRSVFWCHDPAPHSSSLLAPSMLYELGKRWLLRHTDRVIVSCPALTKVLVERYRIREEQVVPQLLCALENLIFADLDGDRDRDIDILFFGRLEPYKGIDVLMGAVNALSERGVPVKVVVAGPGSLRVELAAGVSVDNRYLPDRELAELISRARVVVLPYRDATGTQAPQTAFAYGTPVVATAVGCLPTYVEHEVTGLVVPPAQPVELADALQRLLGDNDLWTRLSDRARLEARTTFRPGRLVERLLTEMLP